MTQPPSPLITRRPRRPRRRRPRRCRTDHAERRASAADGRSRRQRQSGQRRHPRPDLADRRAHLRRQDGRQPTRCRRTTSARLLVDKAREGKSVVRPEGWRSFVFGRGGEEMDVLIEAGVPVDIVPGVRPRRRSQLRLPAHAPRPRAELRLRHRSPRDHRRPRLAGARPPGQTVVIYMGVTGLETISRNCKPPACCPATRRPR